MVLENGPIFQGRHLGGGEKAGEVVFNTAHSGYEEVATDPSYFSQIVVMTSPEQGNYGVDNSCWQDERLWIQGFVCVNMKNSPSNSAWLQELNKHKVPVLDQVDTRSLTQYLRENGSVYGAIVKSSTEEEAKVRAGELIKEIQSLDKDWPFLISKTEKQVMRGKNLKGPKVAILDFGCKSNIINELLLRCSEVSIFPPRTSADEIRQYQPQGILLSNGPGDPEYVQESTQIVRSLIGEFFMFGICMGCQVLAKALGAETRKLRFGHRGVNHPVKDLQNNSIYMTSQNHGYVVIGDSLPADVEVTHINLNDRTLQGFASKKNRLMAVQFHPENHPGPQDSLGLFDRFIQQIS